MNEEMQHVCTVLDLGPRAVNELANGEGHKSDNVVGLMSRQQLPHDLAVHVSEAEIAARVAVSQLLVIEAK